MAIASEAGCEAVSLTVSERNPVAVGLYESVGFVVTGRSAS
jgi:ribosomal protein S18 acetylase RimI-like enzyme